MNARPRQRSTNGLDVGSRNQERSPLSKNRREEETHQRLGRNDFYSQRSNTGTLISFVHQNSPARGQDPILSDPDLLDWDQFDRSREGGSDDIIRRDDWHIQTQTK
jgi:hypothetical protein